mgnify:CR=1 FL=1
MGKMKVFVTRKLPGEGVDLLRKSFDVRVAAQTGPISKTALLKGAAWADALVTLLTDKIDNAFLDKNSHLRVISNYAVGYDNIDIVAATKHGVMITNTPGVLTESVAEHAIALMMCMGKRVLEADAFTRAGKYKYWDPMLLLGTEFDGKTVGVVGVGRIGSVFCKFAHALNMKILYSDVNVASDIEQQYGAKKVDLDALLRASDVVSIHVPLLPSTRHLIDAVKLKLMKRTAFLINTSRGPVVDEKALVVALKRKQIAGAGIDVYEFEPKLAQGLAKLHNVVLTPHIASGTFEARNEMSLLVAKNVLAALNGQTPPSLVNKDVLEGWKKTGA